MWEVIFYFIIVFPLGYRNYLKNKNYSLSAKLMNLIVSFLLSIYFASELRRQVWELIENGTSIFLLHSEIGIPQWFHVLSSVIYFLVCFHCSALAISLGIKKNYTRQLLIKSIPIIGILLIINSAILFMKEDSSMVGRFMYSCIISIIFWVPIFLSLVFVLRSRPMKEMYAEK